MPSASEQQAVDLQPELEQASPWAVSTEDLSIVYKTHFDKKPTLSKSLRRLGRRQRIVRQIRALRGVTLDVPRGEVLGVIGVNGAGKSTLMRAIAGILPPTEGRVIVRGRVSTLLALGIGFHGALSGRENVYLGGLAAGLTPEQVDAKYDEIAEFSELGDFLDLPMRSYSSGMYSRLAFSVSVNVDPDILLIDEALSVGDAKFKQKSFGKMRELCDQAGTIILVSHGLRMVRRLCTEVVWLHEGKVAAQGEPEAVIDEYTRFLDVRDNDEAQDE